MKPSNWREQALLLFPERVSLYQQSSETIWDVFFDLLPEAVAAHLSGDFERLNRIYQFTEWCHNQKDAEPEIWIAATAAFYEHLPDTEITLMAIPRWVKPSIFRDLIPIFQERLDSEAFKKVLSEYWRSNPGANSL